MPLEQFTNLAQTITSGAIDNVTSPVTFSVNNAGPFPATPQFRVLIDSEIMLVTTVSGSNFTAVRGAATGETPTPQLASHVAGATVTEVLTAAAILNGFVRQLLAGSSISLNPASGQGTVTISVSLDTTATDIQALGTQAAGGAGVGADAKHVHPAQATTLFTASNGITVTTGGLTVTAGGLTVSAGGSTITGTSTLSGVVALNAPAASAAAETIGVQTGAWTLTATGAIATQRFNTVLQPTITASSAQTITTAASLAIAGAPIQAGSATITNPYSLWIQAGQSLFAGQLNISSGGLSITAGGAAITGASSVSGSSANFTVNPSSGFVGTILALQVAGVNKLTVDNNGTMIDVGIIQSNTRFTVNSSGNAFWDALGASGTHTWTDNNAATTLMTLSSGGALQLVPTTGYLDLSPVTASQATLNQGTTAGDRLFLASGGASTTYGFGVQTAGLVSFVPSAKAWSFRTAAATGAASSGTEVASISGAGVITAANYLATAGSGLDTSATGTLAIGNTNATTVNIGTVASANINLGPSTKQLQLVGSTGAVTIQAGGLTVSAGGASFSGSTTITGTGHVLGTGTSVGTPTAGAALGTSPPAPSATGNDLRGSVSFGTGTATTTGALITVPFGTVFSAAPIVVVTPASTGGATTPTSALRYYVTSTTTGFTINCNTAPDASQGATVYSFNFEILG